MSSQCYEFGIRDPEKTYSGSQGQKGSGSRSQKGSGSRGQKCTGSRIRNTVFKTGNNVPADKLKKCEKNNISCILKVTLKKGAGFGSASKCKGSPKLLSSRVADPDPQESALYWEPGS
jgi:hypothetical protein